VSRRARGRAVALAVTAVLAVAACGEKQEHVGGPSRADVRALVAAGLAAAESNAVPSAISFRLDGTVLRIRAMAARPGAPLLRLAASFRAVRARIEPFCPKPAVLRCRPALRAWAWPLSRAGVAPSVATLRRLARRTYGERPLVRRRGGLTRLVTANGELLAAVRASAGGVALSFGGVRPPRGADRRAGGRLRIAAGGDGLAALRPLLPVAARRALAGVRRMVAWLTLQ
jgi:hypothetical protein